LEDNHVAVPFIMDARFTKKRIMVAVLLVYAKVIETSI
jgi:hypothetical protein